MPWGTAHVVINVQQNQSRLYFFIQILLKHSPCEFYPNHSLKSVVFNLF